MSEKDLSEFSDIVETEGKDRGRIKDIELAVIGAEREQRVRGQRLHNGLLYLANHFTAEGDIRFSHIYSSPHEQVESRSHEEGEEAMAEEIEKRKYATLLKGGFSKKDARFIASRYKEEFLSDLFRINR